MLAKHIKISLRDIQSFHNSKVENIQYSDDKIINVENLEYEYSGEENDAVLKDFNLSIERGSFTAILGHNGSGKSTLAKLLNGLLKPINGKISVDGLYTDDEKNEIEIKRRVGLVFQNPDNQLVSSVVEEDVAFGPENLGLAPEVIRERVDEALKIVGMYDYRKKSPHNLSGGQKQRVAIAGILAMKPECIVLDEPTAMLDPQGRKEVLEALIDLNRNHKITIIFITHYMEEVIDSDQVFVMDQGHIVMEGTPKEIFSRVEELKSYRLDVPQVTLLAHELKKAGVEVPDGILTAKELVDALCH